MIPLSSLYAPWHKRFAAYLIDVVALYLSCMLLALGTLVQFDSTGHPILAPISTLVFFLANMAYFVFFFGSKRQATPGMIAMSIHVIRTDGRALTQRDGAERFLAFVLPSLPLYASFLSEQVTQSLAVCLSIAWFMPILTTRVGLHDRMCNMRVINGRVP